ncbi:MAG TPA: VWA domain-containing protein [Thermoanaerobaculia bacterium]|nr:VWA domain-containing protein [Thermoanaerobaculia bacterium]
MTLRPIALLLTLVLAAANTPAQPNNPEPPSGQDRAGRPDSTQDPGERKLSRGERRERIKNLSEEKRQFLRDVEPIMLDRELITFLLLETDAQRDLYIEEFWRRRDPDPLTSYNQYREGYFERLERAKIEFKHLASDRSRVYLVKGEPAERIKVDCESLLVPLEVWRYLTGTRFSSHEFVVFYKPRNGGDFVLWQPLGGRGFDDLTELLSHDGQRQGIGVFAAFGGIEMQCINGDKVLGAINWVQANKLENAKVFEPPAIDTEDINAILRAVVIENPDAPKIEASMEARFPGRRGSRTSAELILSIARKDLGLTELEGNRYYNVDLTGEILKNDKLFENFRYRYDFPAESVGETLNVVVERFLRPADYKARIKLVDVNSGAEAILEKDLAVPYIRESQERRARELEGSRTVDHLLQEFRTGESQLRVIPLPNEILTGLQKIETIVTGDRIEAVEFYLDGTKVMTKRRPPYELELDFGSVPRQRRVKAVALDADGKFVGGDELAINVGSDPFRVWIEQPRVSMNLSGNVRVEVDAKAPEGSEIERVEIWLNEARLATLYESPYIQSIHVPEGLRVGYLRAVAYMNDPTTQPAEDVVFLNAPDFIQEVDVHLVELPITVLRNGKPVQDLGQSAFRVVDEGNTVEISRFEHVKNLPLSIGLSMDASGSMQPRMDEAQKAGAQFFSKVLRPGDKAFVTAFDTEAYTVQKWSPKLADLHAGLASLRAEEATALYDALVYSLYHFQGVRGQKALVLISDGKDTASKFTFDQALEYARRSAVPIYAVGIGIRQTEIDAKFKLRQLAKETGGNTYFIESTADLSPIYDDIENELRSQYVIGFYPPAGVEPGGDWREIDVVVENGVAKTIRGYYP